MSSVAMHLGIGLFLGMWTFGLAMIFTYTSYVPPEAVQRWGQRVLSWRTAATTTHKYHPTSTWQVASLALRCAFDPRETIETLAVTPPAAPVVAVPAPALSPGDWWRQLRNQPPVWNFPAAADGQHSPPRVLLVRSYLRPLMELQEYFLTRGFEPRIATDLPSAGLALTTSPFDALVVMVEKTSDWPDAEMLREICLSGGRRAPVTIFATTQQVSELIDARPTTEHRILVYPFSKRELREQVGEALLVRGINAAPQDEIISVVG